MSTLWLAQSSKGNNCVYSAPCMYFSMSGLVQTRVSFAYLDWLTKSYDINLIENVWPYFEQRVKRRQWRLSNLVVLHIPLTSDWDQMDTAHL